MFNPVDYTIDELEHKIPSMGKTSTQKTLRYATGLAKAREKLWGRRSKSYIEWDNIAFLCRKRLRKLTG